MFERQEASVQVSDTGNSRRDKLKKKLASFKAKLKHQKTTNTSEAPVPTSTMTRGPLIAPVEPTGPSSTSEAARISPPPSFSSTTAQQTQHGGMFGESADTRLNEQEVITSYRTSSSVNNNSAAAIGTGAAATNSTALAASSNLANGASTQYQATKTPTTNYTVPQTIETGVSTSMIREQPILDKVNIVEHMELVKQPILDEHHRQEVIEVHEKPIEKQILHPPHEFIFQEQPQSQVEGYEMALQERQRILNELIEGDRKHPVQVREDVDYVCKEEPIYHSREKRLEKEIVNIPIVTEIHQQPIREIHEQQIERVIYERPTVVVIRDPPVIETYSSSKPIEGTAVIENIQQRLQVEKSHATSTSTTQSTPLGVSITNVVDSSKMIYEEEKRFQAQVQPSPPSPISSEASETPATPISPLSETGSNLNMKELKESIILEVKKEMPILKTEYSNEQDYNEVLHRLGLNVNPGHFQSVCNSFDSSSTRDTSPNVPLSGSRDE
jgi:hypothetical protein